jgi:hypothetical protein
MSTATAAPTIDDARAIYARADADFRAGRIDRDAIGREFDTFEATVKQLDVKPPVEGCPDWCNDHEFMYGLTIAEDVSNHRRTVKGQGWSLEVSEVDLEPGKYELMTWLESGLCDSLPLEAARAYAVAILETIDTVTGATR